MLSVLIDGQVVDEDGETTWTQVQLTASDDPARDSIDLTLQCALSESDNVMLDPIELRRALDIVAAERKLAVDGL